eukprot:tig00000663_g2985.t1
MPAAGAGGLSLVEFLSSNVLIEIFKHLPKGDLLRAVGKVCRRWRSASLAPELWAELTVADDTGGASARYGASGFFSVPLASAAGLLSSLRRDGVTALDVSLCAFPSVALEMLLPLLPALAVVSLPSPGGGSSARTLELLAEHAPGIASLTLGRAADTAGPAWSSPFAAALGRLRRLESVRVLCPVPLESLLLARGAGWRALLVRAAAAGAGPGRGREPLAALAAAFPALRDLELRLEAPEGASPRRPAPAPPNPTPSPAPQRGAGGAGRVPELPALQRLSLSGALLAAGALEALAGRLVRLEAETAAPALLLAGDALESLRLAGPPPAPRPPFAPPLRASRAAAGAAGAGALPAAGGAARVGAPGARAAGGARGAPPRPRRAGGALRELEVRGGAALLSTSLLHARHVAALPAFELLDSLTITRAALEAASLSVRHGHLHRLRLENCCASAPATARTSAGALPARVLARLEIRCPNLRSLQLRLGGGPRAPRPGPASSSSSEDDDGEDEGGGVDAALPEEEGAGGGAPARLRPGLETLVPAPALFASALGAGSGVRGLEGAELEGLPFADDLWLAAFLARHPRLRSLALAALPLRTPLLPARPAPPAPRPRPPLTPAQYLRELTLRGCSRLVGACLSTPRLRALRLVALPLFAPELLATLREAAPRLRELEAAQLDAPREAALRCPAPLRTVAVSDAPRLQRVRVEGGWALREVRLEGLPALRAADLELPHHCRLATADIPETAKVVRSWSRLRSALHGAEARAPAGAAEAEAGPAGAGGGLEAFACLRGCLGSRPLGPPGSGEVKGLPPAPAPAPAPEAPPDTGHHCILA